jgi:hypothetical protein
LGRAITVTVTGTKAGYIDVPKLSGATAAVALGTFATPPVPTITGTKVVGDTVTANEGTWSSVPDSFTYVWKRGTTTISGASGKTYQLQAADRGQSITVLVTGVRAGFTSATSAPSAAFTGIVAPFTDAPTPTITVAGGGPAQVGRVLTAVTGSWSPAPAFTYAWKRGTTVIGTASTYTVVAADLGQPITVTVTGTLATYVTTSKESLATENVIKGTFGTTPTPTITGAVTTNSTLTAVPGTWAPVQDSYTYQWTVGDTVVAAPLGTGATYAVLSGDLGKTITVTVTAKKNAYDDVSKTSLPTAAVSLPLIATAPTPTITGTVRVASTLTAVPGAVPAGATVKSYQWSSATTATGVYTNIPDATERTYVLKPADVATFVKVTVTWAKSGNGDTPKLSAATVAVAAGTFGTAPVPTITGSKVVGDTVTANEGTWSSVPDSFTYVWKRGTTTISGASGKTYQLQAADRGQSISVVVTGVRAGFTSASGTSAAFTGIVAPFTEAPTPTITVAGGGVAAVGKVLTAVTGSWSPAPAFTYSWKRGSTVIGTASTYTVTAADVGQPITVTVTGTLATYATTVKTSDPTDAVIKGTFGTTPTPTITLSTGATAPFATKTITASVGGTWAPLQDSLTYQWAVAGVLVGAPSTVATSYTVKAADVGKKITVTVTAKKNGYDDLARTSAESAPVTLGFITWPTTPAPTKPTISGTVKAGSTLTAAPGTAPAGATFVGYQWSRATTATGVYTNIADAATETYTLTGADTAKFVKVAAIWSKTDHSNTDALSAATAAVAVLLATSGSPSGGRCWARSAALTLFSR